MMENQAKKNVGPFFAKTEAGDTASIYLKTERDGWGWVEIGKWGVHIAADDLLTEENRQGAANVAGRLYKELGKEKANDLKDSSGTAATV